MNLSAMTGRKMVLYVALIDKAHSSSSCSVAGMNVARLERSQECRRRGERYGVLSQAYAEERLRAATRFSSMSRVRRIALCRHPRIGNRIANREVVYDLSLVGRQAEITVHLIVVEGADTGRAQPERFRG